MEDEPKLLKPSIVDKATDVVDDYIIEQGATCDPSYKVTAWVDLYTQGYTQAPEGLAGFPETPCEEAPRKKRKKGGEPPNF